jgi:hypothetical protein
MKIETFISKRRLLLLLALLSAFPPLSTDMYLPAIPLLVFFYFMMGAFAMWLISLNWSDKIRLIGILGAGAGSLLLSLWLCLPQTLTRSAQRIPPR